MDELFSKAGTDDRFHFGDARGDFFERSIILRRNLRGARKVLRRLDTQLEEMLQTGAALVEIFPPIDFLLYGLRVGGNGKRIGAAAIVEVGSDEPDGVWIMIEFGAGA